MNRQDSPVPLPSPSLNPVSVAIPLEVFSTDFNGVYFSETARTELVSRHGGVIAIRRLLSPEQELVLKHVESKREVASRVIGQMGTLGEDSLYAVLFCDPDVDFWVIPFSPAPAQLEVRVVVECTHCSTREPATLDDLELVVLRAGQKLSRHCRKCSQSTQCPAVPVDPGSFASPEENAPAADAPATESPARPLRKYKRLNVKLPGCVSIGEAADEVQVTNTSTGGLCFQTHKTYRVGEWVKVAVPFTSGAVNFFVSARVVWGSPGTVWNSYGLQYTAPDRKP